MDLIRFSGIVIKDAKHGHIRQEIDRSDFHAIDLQSQTLLQVCLQLFITLGLNQVYVIVAYILTTFILRGEEAFAEPYAQNEDGIHCQLFQEVDTVTLPVEHTECNKEEKVSHLADGHTLPYGNG